MSWWDRYQAWQPESSWDRYKVWQLEPEIHDEPTKCSFVSELSSVPLAVYEEPIPVPPEWPDAPCAYVRLSESYPDSEKYASQKRWPTRRLDGGHFLLLTSQQDVASALIDIVSESSRHPRNG